MNKEIQERIECIKNNQLPEGYRRVKDIGIAPEDWTLGKMSDVIENVSRPVPKPNEPYWRLGIKSWAKGTFRAFVDDPETVNMDKLYEVKENDLIVNITFAWEHAIAIAKKEDEGLLVSHRFPTYEFKKGQIPEYYQAIITQRYFKDMLDHISPGGAGRNRVLNRKAFLNLPCIIPPEAEQEKTAKILSNCEKVIELKEKMFEQKEKYKKFLVQQLLLNNQDAVKDNNWQTIKIKDIFDFLKGVGLSKENVIETGKNKCILYGELFTTYDCKINKIYSRTDSGEGVLSKKNDILMPCSTTTKGVDLATASVINENDVLLGGDILILRPKKTIDVNFFAYLISSLSKKISLCTQGITIIHLQTSDFKNMEVKIPSTLEEQKKISDILSAIDNDIAMSRQEILEWNRYKRFLTQILLRGIVR